MGGPPVPDDDAVPPPAPDPAVVPDDADIDSVPPPPLEAGDTDGDDPDDEYIDPEAFRQSILDEMQTRFDRSISKVVRRMQKGQTPSPTGGGGSGDDPDDGDSPPPAPRPGARQVDTKSIRTYARSVLNDAMEGQGRVEKQAIRDILDGVVATTNWASVDDEEEYVEELVERLTTTTQALIKIGSDRKVAQLRASGRLPQLATQPGQAQTGAAHSAQTGMAKGAATAKQRWPGGRRRMTG